MRFVIVTGVSGAGKSTVLKMLEDAHYFCVDNLPIPLVEKFASLMLEVHEEGVQNAALGIDARSGHSLEELAQVLDHMKEAGYDFKDVVSATVYIIDMNDFTKINGVYDKYLGEVKPARACVEVARLPKDVKVEIGVIAVK